MTQSSFINLAAAVVSNGQGSYLFVRKRQSAYYMLAGGKIEAQEDSFTALVRELQEELHIAVPTYLPQWVGQFTAPAANEKGYQVRADIFKLYWPYPIQADAEIEQAVWLSPSELAHTRLAPLARHVLSHWNQHSAL